MGLFDSIFKKKEEEKKVVPMKWNEEDKDAEKLAVSSEQLAEQDEVIEENEEIKEEFTNVASKVEEKSEEVIDKFKEEVEEKVEKIEEGITEEAEEIEEEITEKVEEIKDDIVEKQNFFQKLVKGLSKTKNNIMNNIDSILKSFTKIDEDLFEELEEQLIMADIGVSATTQIISDIRESVKSNRITEPNEIKELLKEQIVKILENSNKPAKEGDKKVLLIIGVNGVGKTTSVGKLAYKYRREGKRVLLAAADTFRAAATEQLAEWAHRANIDLIKHSEGADPGAVVYDAIQSAKARKTDILIVDTAGRLHNKKNLMDELRKIYKIIDKEYEGAVKEMLLVLDATTGQNALQQAKLFGEIIEIDGLILTKLDGTAKGGIVVAINKELNIPVKYIGVGEGIEDLQEFDAKVFVEALFE